MANIAFRNFAGGEVSPEVYSRVDLPKYQTAVRQMRNFIAQRHGGVAMRPGTETVASTKGDEEARLIGLVIADTDTDVYILEFGDGYVRFHQAGEPMLASSVPVWGSGTDYVAGTIVADNLSKYHCRQNHTSAPTNEPGGTGAWQTFWYKFEGDIIELPAPYAPEDLRSIRFSALESSLALVHPKYPPHELKRTVKGTPDLWTLQPIVFGSKLSAPTNLAATGGSAGTVFWAVTAVDAITGEESLPVILSSATNLPSSGAPSDLTWQASQNATKYNIYRSLDNITYGLVGVVSAGNPGNNTTDNTWTPGTDLEVVTGAIGNFTPITTVMNILTMAVSGDKAVDGKYTINGAVSFDTQNLGSTPFTTDVRIRASYSRNGETSRDAGVIFTAPTLIGAGAYGPQTFTGVITVPDNGYTALVIFLQAEVLIDTDGPDTQTTLQLDGTTVQWNKTAIHFKDTNQSADNTSVPPQDPKYFLVENEYPSAVTHYQQRRVFANSNNNTGRVFASRTGSPNNFLRVRPITANAPVVFDMDGHRTINVRHLLDLARLVAFNSSQEKVIDGEVQSGILKPDALNVRTHSYNGIGNLPPIPLGDIALYVQARGNQVRLLKPDASNTGMDLTVFAGHLFKRRKLLEWDYAFMPDSVVWAIRQDGVMLGMTFLTDQDVWGWHRHDTLGTFESVAVVPEGTDDIAYVVVKRTINGVTKRFVERMAAPAVAGVTDIRDVVYMDASTKAFDGRNQDPTNTLTLAIIPPGAESLETESSEELDSDTDSQPLETEGLDSNDAQFISITSQVDTFVLDDIGATLLVITPSGARAYVKMVTFVSPTQVLAFAEQFMSDEFFGTAIVDWARTADHVSGLAYLANQEVSVLADGYVLSSPNNPEYPTMIVDDLGNMAFSHPYSVIRVGLPYVADLETLDIDTIPSTIKNRKRIISRIILSFENSADVYVGRPISPTNDNLVQDLQLLKLRDTEDYTDPTSLITDDRDIVPIIGHNTNGRVFIRQLDPLPTTISMVAPTFAED